MDRSVSSRVVALALLLLGTAMAAAAQSPLVHYSFDDDQLDAGPDTFAVFQFGQGTVKLSSLNRFSGYRSVELRDVAGDHTFPELQGYFPLRSEGKLYLHFAFMTTNPAEELNIALAGPAWFKLRKHGIGFWLKTDGEGNLVAISDSMPKKLVALRQFTWYVVDAVYDIDAGAFDLTIHQEGLAEPLVALVRQPNAANQPGSRVDKFSFIGDHDTDRSNVVYYVDDVVVSTDEAAARQHFAAPGRRKLFFDYWAEAQRARMAHPAPLPMTNLAEVGIGAVEAAILRSEQQGAALLGEILSGSSPALPEPLGSRSRQILTSLLAWRAGHAALLAGEAKAALAHFERASELAAPAPTRLFRMDAVLALAHLGRWEDVDRALPGLGVEWRGDPRLPVALAMIGLARLDVAGVEEQLAVSTNESLNEQYFLALLWKGEQTRAAQFATAMMARSPEPLRWSVRLGDAAFVAGDLARARTFYEASLAGHMSPAEVWLKLSDVYFQLGDFERERGFRERVYGSLRAQETN